MTMVSLYNSGEAVGDCLVVKFENFGVHVNVAPFLVSAIGKTLRTKMISNLSCSRCFLWQSAEAQPKSTELFW
jgi:hypothetical protein